MCSDNTWVGLLYGKVSACLKCLRFMLCGHLQENICFIIWVMSWVGFFFFFMELINKAWWQQLCLLLDLVIWQTFSQDWVTLAYCFKENDLPIIIASNKIEISSKTYSSGECVSFTGNLGSLTWPKDFSNEMNKINTLFLILSKVFFCI